MLLGACGPGPVGAPDASQRVAADDAVLAKGGSQPGVSYLVSAVDHGGSYIHPTWTSTRDGTTSETTLFTTWTGDAIVVTPTGSAYTLGDDAQMTTNLKAGRILGVTLYIQDVAGPAGVQHETDRVILAAPVTPSTSGFVLHVHRDAVPVYRLKGHTGGPRVGMIGTISVGDLVFTPR
jgi:hypothetical protein